MTSADLTASMGPSPLVGAASWVEQLLTGTVATTVAVIAVAWLGYLTLSGRIDLRRALTILLGCFILFGAPVIAQGVLRLTEAGGGPLASVVAAPVASFPTPLASAAPATVDPYAGASVPVER